MARKVMTHQEKVDACRLELVSAKPTTYNVTSPTGNTYQVVANPSGNITCNCECGRRKHNSPCAHADAVRQTIQVAAPVALGAEINYVDAPLFDGDPDFVPFIDEMIRL